MTIDYERINKFIDGTDLRRTTGSLFRRSGFEITKIKETSSPSAWGVYLKPNQNMKDLLSIPQEILLFLVDYPELQPRTFTQAMDIIELERPRLSEQLILIISPDTNTNEIVKNTSLQGSATFVGFSEAEISEFSVDKKSTIEFTSVLQSRFYTKDLYWQSGPIENPRHFYGRKQQLDEVANSLVNTHTHIGLFGLRKTGKTSFLYRLIELLRQQYQCHFCYLDIELIDPVDPSAEYFLWSLGSSIFDSLGKLRIKNLQLIDKKIPYYQIENKDVIVELFVHDMQAVLSQTKKVIVVALDEIDLMAPSDIIDSSHWSNDAFIRIWRILRGLAQQNPGKISFFITGTNPKLIEINRIDKTDNPIYDFFRKDYLRPLPGLDSRELLKGIGKLAGLDWSEEAISLVHKRVGGHPLLLRAYGSLIHKSMSPRSSMTQVTIDHVTSQSENFIRTVNSRLSQMLDVISDYYKWEYTLLELLATGRIGEFKEYATEFPDETSHLIGYGLVEYTFSKCEIIVEPLQTWVQRRKNSVKMDFNQEGDPLIGKNIDGYTIKAKIGHVGGFAKVYRAISENLDEHVAIKVIQNGLTSVLQREVDILSEVRHPNIVEMKGSGRTPDGVVYLIMEYLEGPTLKSFCDRTSRLAPEQLLKITKDILLALSYLHPDSDSLDKFRMKKVLDPQDYAKIERAKHGRIHRDIKPQNIILNSNRGAVLIDFNISVTATSPAQTQSHTPGYLPPDLQPGQWTPDVDLYQLGITLAQISTGIEYYFSDSDGENNLADIREQVEVELHPNFASILLKLCSPRKHQRFTSAKEVLERLKSAPKLLR